MMGSMDSFDASAANTGAATSRAERHLQRELAELKQQFQFAAVQHREDVNIMRSKLMEMQQQLSQACTSRDEAYEAVVNERAVAALRVQESEAAHREATKTAQQLRDKLLLEEQRCRDMARAIDAAQKDVEHYKLRLETLEQQQQVQLHKLQQYDQLQLDSKRQAIAAHHAQQQLQQELQNQLQQHQRQMDALRSQLQQQLTSAQNECSASQRSLIDSERQRSLADERANRSVVFSSISNFVESLRHLLRNFEELSQALQQLQVLPQSLENIPAAHTLAGAEG
jgi:chromosome segregation ATPase